MNTPTQQQIEDAAKEHRMILYNGRWSAHEVEEHTKTFIAGANYYKSNSGNDAVWISVKDRLPTSFISGNFDGRKSEPVIAIDNHGCCYVAIIYQGTLDGCIFADWYNLYAFDIPNVTHWMPLPKPPKD